MSVTPVKCLELMENCTCVCVLSDSDFPQKISPFERKFKTSFLFFAEMKVQNDYIK